MNIDNINTTSSFEIIINWTCSDLWISSNFRWCHDSAQVTAPKTLNNINVVVVSRLQVSIDIQRMTTAENIWMTQAISHYTANEISEAKQELWKICRETFIGKMIRRKGTRKTKTEFDINPGLITFQRLFLVHLYSGGTIFGGLYVRGGGSIKMSKWRKHLISQLPYLYVYVYV